jgi:hypothetical protein
MCGRLDYSKRLGKTVAPIAARAFAVTGRAVPAALRDLVALTAQHFPDADEVTPFGLDLANLTEVFRANIYRA